MFHVKVCLVLSKPYGMRLMATEMVLSLGRNLLKFRVSRDCRMRNARAYSGDSIKTPMVS